MHSRFTVVAVYITTGYDTMRCGVKARLVTSQISTSVSMPQERALPLPYQTGRSWLRCVIFPLLSFRSISFRCSLARSVDSRFFAFRSKFWVWFSLARARSVRSGSIMRKKEVESLCGYLPIFQYLHYEMGGDGPKAVR